ncbi:MAG: SHD1 domain-containing protein [Planctomycetota bacterium]
MSRSFRRSLRVVMTWTAILLITVEPTFAGHVLQKLRGCGGGSCAVGGRLRGALSGLRGRVGGIGACASCGGDCGGGCGAGGRLRGMVTGALSRVRGCGSCGSSSCGGGCHSGGRLRGLVSSLGSRLRGCGGCGSSSCGGGCEAPVATCEVPVEDSCGCAVASSDVSYDTVSNEGAIVSEGAIVDSGYIESSSDCGCADSGYVDSGYVVSEDAGYVSGEIVVGAVSEGVVYGDDYSYTPEVAYEDTGCSSCCASCGSGGDVYAGDVISEGIAVGGEVYSDGAISYDSGYVSEAPMGCVDGNCGGVVSEGVTTGDVTYGDTMSSDIVSEDSGTVISDTVVEDGSSTRIEAPSTTTDTPMDLDLGGGSDLVADPPTTAPDTAATDPAPPAGDSGAFQPVPGDDDILSDDAPATTDAAADPADDLFPADPPADAGAADDAAGGTDDLFPADDAGGAADPADDLFPADDAAPAGDDPAGEAPSEESGDDIDDLFGSNSRVRTWVDNTGKYSTVGRLVELNTSNVRILKENGRLCTVPLRRLSPADFDLVQKIASMIGKSPIARVAAR